MITVCHSARFLKGKPRDHCSVCRRGNPKRTWASLEDPDSSAEGTRWLQPREARDLLKVTWLVRNMVESGTQLD